MDEIRWLVFSRYALLGFLSMRLEDFLEFRRRQLQHRPSFVYGTWTHTYDIGGKLSYLCIIPILFFTFRYAIQMIYISNPSTEELNLEQEIAFRRAHPGEEVPHWLQATPYRRLHSQVVVTPPFSPPTSP